MLAAILAKLDSGQSRCQLSTGGQGRPLRRRGQAGWHHADVDDHQRRVWGRMLDSLDAYDAGIIDLAKLSSDLKGLLGAADLHDESLVTDFWDHFAEIEMELELRTEGWAPAGSSSDERLKEALGGYRQWVQAVLSDANDQRSDDQDVPFCSDGSRCPPAGIADARAYRPDRPQPGPALLRDRRRYRRARWRSFDRVKR
jgi:hypothetical protein